MNKTNLLNSFLSYYIFKKEVFYQCEEDSMKTLYIEDNQINLILQSTMAELYSNYIHKIDNMLTIILMDLKYLSNSSDKIDVDDRYKKANINVKKISHILNQIMRWHRSSSKNSPKLINVNGIFDDLELIYKNKLSSNSINLKVDIGLDLTMVLYEEVLVQIIVQIIHLSLKNKMTDEQDQLNFNITKESDILKINIESPLSSSFLGCIEKDFDVKNKISFSNNTFELSVIKYLLNIINGEFLVSTNEKINIVIRIPEVKG